LIFIIAVGVGVKYRKTIKDCLFATKAKENEAEEAEVKVEP